MLILSTKLKNAINKQADGMGLTFTLKNISINGRKRGCSGFIRNNANGSVIYVNTELIWIGEVTPYMYRYANDEKDYTGYHNRWANTLDELATEICRLLHNTPQEVNDRRI
jgi:hypothetical protein